MLWGYRGWLLKQNTAVGGPPRAVGYFSVTIIFDSLISLVIAWSDGVESPFLFNSGMTFGVVIGCLFFLFANHRDVVSDRRVLKVIWQRMFSLANCMHDRS